MLPALFHLERYGDQLAIEPPREGYRGFAEIRRSRSARGHGSAGKAAEATTVLEDAKTRGVITESSGRH